MRLNKSLVDKAKIPKPKPNGQTNQEFYRDSALPGFGLRVTSGGSKSFIVEKRIDGKVKRKTLGKYGPLTVEQARKLAQIYLGQVAGGHNPISDQKESNLKKLTLADVFDDYLATRKDLKPSTIKEYSRQLKGSFGDWQKKRITDINKDMIEMRHRELGERSAANANGAMRVLRALFNHAMNKYEDKNGVPFIQTNPVDRLNKNRAWYPSVRRQTIIKPHQLKEWYDATLQLNRPVTRSYLHFVLLTGLRRTEAATLEWKNVDFKDRTFTVPDTKNKLPHTLPMSDAIYDILLELKTMKENQWVFPSHVSNTHLKDPKVAVIRIRELSGIYFSLHDLRRTFITIAESLDISAYALKRLMNHKDSNDVTAGYIISNVERLRKPMEEISNFILAEFKGDKC
jgi:integrase